MLWLIILMIALAVLPDLLRRRRQKRKGPIPVPPRRKPLQAQYKLEADQALQVEEAASATTVETPAEGADIVPPPAAETARINTAAPLVSQPAPTVVPSRQRVAPWSTLTPQARELYSGLVWSELWQAPLAKRPKRGETTGLPKWRR